MRPFFNLKEFVFLLVFCVFSIFCITAIVQFGMWGVNFLRGGVFEFGMAELKKAALAGGSVGSVAAVGIWVMSLLEERDSGTE